MAAYKEYRSFSIPSIGELKKKKKEYHVFVDGYKRMYYVDRKEFDRVRSSDDKMIEDAYIVLCKAYNSNPEQFIDDDDGRYNIPEGGSEVFLRRNAKNVPPSEIRTVYINSSYRNKWNRVGIVSLIFDHGVPPIK
jgi:hypothetical protein